MRPGQVWRCRAGGLWRLVERDDERGEWIAQAAEGVMLWRYKDDGTSAVGIRAGKSASGIDLIELVAQ